MTSDEALRTLEVELRPGSPLWNGLRARDPRALDHVAGLYAAGGFLQHAAYFKQLAWRIAGDVSAQGTATGFTPTDVTFAKLRQMHTLSAAPLDADIREHVTDPTFRAAWTAWYERDHLPFYEKYAGPSSSLWYKLGALVESDDIARRAEAQRAELESFYDSYRAQRSIMGSPLPPPRGTPPTLDGLPAQAPRVPTWVWPVGLVAVGVGLWFVLRPHLRPGVRDDGFLTARDRTSAHSRRTRPRAEQGG